VKKNGKLFWNLQERSRTTIYRINNDFEGKRKDQTDRNLTGIIKLLVTYFLSMSKKKLVVLSGAGVSAESGLKTFRDSDGLWEGYNIEDVATPRAWRKDPKLVLDFYNYRRRNVLDAQPNAAHYGLAELEKDFDVTIITQNIDDLHERAGSTNVLHLHGEIFKMRSERAHDLIYEITGDIKIGDKAEDGEQLRPYIVWFEEPVPKIEEAIPIVTSADIFVVVGTSLVVYPAAGLVNFAARHIPKYIIDKRIPYTSEIANIFAIEKPATEGVRDLMKLLF
jgi:NAD-dependent deacetylase